MAFRFTESVNHIFQKTASRIGKSNEAKGNCTNLTTKHHILYTDTTEICHVEGWSMLTIRAERSK